MWDWLIILQWHVIQCKGVAYWCVFIRFWTTIKVCDTQDTSCQGLATQKLVKSCCYWSLTVFANYKKEIWNMNSVSYHREVWFVASDDTVCRVQLCYIITADYQDYHHIFYVSVKLHPGKKKKKKTKEKKRKNRTVSPLRERGRVYGSKLQAGRGSGCIKHRERWRDRRDPPEWNRAHMSHSTNFPKRNLFTASQRLTHLKSDEFS